MKCRGYEQVLLVEIVEHVLQNVIPGNQLTLQYKEIWSVEQRGYFIVKIAWEYVRQRKVPTEFYRKFLIK